jgi:hypothetical protein
MADNLTTFKCRLSRNLGASSSWNAKGLSRPVMGLLFFIMTLYIKMCPFVSVFTLKMTSNGRNMWEKVVITEYIWN